MAYLATVASFNFADIPTGAMLRVFRELGCVRSQFYRNQAVPFSASGARALADECRLAFDSIHGVFGPEFDPSSPDEPTRRSAVKTYENEGRLAVELGGPMVVVHPSPIVPNGVSFTPNDPARAEPLRRSIQELADIGERIGVVYLLENQPENYRIGSDPRLVARFVREANRASVRMCFDVGHAHLTSADGAARALRDCRDVVAYIHVHDNDGKLDRHLIPGQGSVDWSAVGEVIATMPAQTPAMLECFQPEAEFRAEMAAGLGARLARLAGVREVAGRA
jgi:sugar phosphate isomerase/epimerase